MRHEKIAKILSLARELASNAAGLTLDEMANYLGESRSSAERVRRIFDELFPGMEEVDDHPKKRFRITRGIDSFFQNPTVDELACLAMVIESAKKESAQDRAHLLSQLESKVRGAIKHAKLLKADPDIEALVRAELIAVQAGPRATENPAVMKIIRNALLASVQITFAYMGGSTPGAERTVIPLGILFGHRNYLIAAEAGTVKPKSWRLDRIENLSALDVPGLPPPDFSLTDFANGMFRLFDEAPQDVILHVLPSGRQEFMNFRFHATQQVEELPSGGALVRFRASGMQELVWHLFAWGNKVEIIEPVSLRQQMTTDLIATLAHHQEPLRHTHTIKKVESSA